MTNRRRIITVGILAFAAISGIAYLFWPRPYVWYISEPLDSHGARVQFLIPRGWVIQRRPAEQLWCLISPPDHPTWWPGFLRQLFPDEDRRFSGLTLYRVPTSDALIMEAANTNPAWLFGRTGRSFNLGARHRKLPNDRDTSVVLLYFRQATMRKSAFESSRATILNSFRFMR